MAKINMPAWYFPTTVAFVDDNLKFLKKMLFNLSGEQMTLKLINESLKALQFLQAQPEQGLINEQFVSVEAENSGTAFETADETLHALDKKMYDENRFDEIGVAIVDYAMPGLNGLEICSQLRAKSSRFKILMLTGEASKNLAVEAFNDGMIDKFMRKDEPEFAQKLLNAIRMLQNAYFLDITTFIFNRLDTDPKNPIAPCLYDEKFAQAFNTICQENNVVEYYLVDSDGTFLLIDAKGIPFLLAVKNKERMSDIYQVAFNASEPFPDAMLEVMKNCQQILCLYGTNICDDPNQAKLFLHPAKKLVCDDVYYYALVKDLSVYDIDLKKISGFRSYVDKINSGGNPFIDKVSAT